MVARTTNDPLPQGFERGVRPLPDFRKYPQIIDFSGHSHDPISDPPRPPTSPSNPDISVSRQFPARRRQTPSRLFRRLARAARTAPRRDFGLRLFLPDNLVIESFKTRPIFGVTTFVDADFDWRTRKGAVGNLFDASGKERVF